MAEESSLDDFFAKKDKSKKKSKSKLTPSDILNKAEDTSVGTKKKKKKEKDRQGAPTPSSTGTTGSDGPKEEEEEEWHEFVEEEKDYSGLRIQNLQISEKEEEEAENEQTEEYEDEDGEMRERKKSSQVPWKQVTAPQAQTASETEEQEPPPPAPKEEPPKTTGKYVPPGARSGASQSSPSPIAPAPLRRKKQAPNLRSEEDFPTLGGFDGRPDGDTMAGGNFEKVQWGGRQAEDPSKAGVKLTLGNKYAALQD